MASAASRWRYRSRPSRAVQGRPASVRTLDAVGDHQVGVQQRIPLPGRPMVEPDRQQPLSGHVLDTAVPTAGPDVGIQVGDRLPDTGMMGVQHGPTSCRIPKPVQHRHALARAQDHVEGWHRPLAMRTAEELAGVGVAALEHCLEPGHGCFALQPEGAGAGAVPAAWTLAVARQVRLVVGSQLADVVLLPTHRQLGDVGHHLRLPPAFVGASERTPGALLSSERLRS
jgi:hypothetical protein